MAKWADIAVIERAVDDMREMERELKAENRHLLRRAEEAEAARDVWRARAEEHAEQLRQAQQTITAMQARDDARFARHSTRIGE